MSLDYLIENWRQVLDLSVDHLQLSATALLLALVVALPLGVAVARFQRVEIPVLGSLGVLYTLPSLAFLALLIPVLGIGRQPALVMLAAYSQVFLVRNIVAGLRGVDPAVLDVAAGMGMTRVQRFYKVQLPLALPVIIAGLRVAFVTTISLASIAAWINAGGLGTLLFNGITRNNASMILAGTIAITALAILIDLALRLAERWTAVGRSRRARR